MAFVVHAPLPQRSASRSASCTTVRMSAGEKPRTMSRRALLTAAAGVVAAAGASALPGPARAEPSGGIQGAVSKIFFPKQGFNAPEETVPGKVSIDRELLSAEPAQKALASLREYRDMIKKATADFESLPASYDIAKVLKDNVKIDSLRDSLNIVNEAFDEETQKTTDKVVRGIIQDIGELVYNGSIRAGIERTPKRVDRIRQWLTKINSDMDYLLGFYN